MFDVLIYAAKGVIFLSAMLAALAAFGCVMCFVNDVDRAPIAKTIGGVIVVGALVTFIGWAISPNAQRGAHEAPHAGNSGTNKETDQ
jgi:hypothetical protein